MAHNAHYGTPDPELAAALEKLPPPFEVVDALESRAKFNNLFGKLVEIQKQHIVLPQENEYELKDRNIPVEGGEIRVRTVVPTVRSSPTEAFPLLVWFHGGGFVLGNPEMDDVVLRKLSVELKISVVNVDYRLAPEYPFPTPPNDCFEAVKWAVNNASELSASPRKGLIIGGCSAGANITSGLAIRARDDPFFDKEKGTAITGQLMQIPSIGFIPEQYKSEIYSHEQHKNGHTLTESQRVVFARAYKADPQSPLYSPLLASSHKNLPPAYFQVSGQDLLRDDGLLYEKVLRENGVKTKLDIYPGYPHGGHNMLFGLEITKKFERDFVQGVKWLIDNAQY
ncbi:AB hydrolase superfamily protein [Abortiporus biennis]